MKKILFLGSQMETGGAQKILLDQANWFHNKGYQVEAVFFYDKEDLHATWKSNPFPVHNLRAWKYKANPISTLLRLIPRIVRLFWLLRRGKFDVVETFTIDSNIIGIPLTWLARTPVRLATHHGDIHGNSTLKKKIHGAIINSKMTTRLVAVSQQIHQLVQTEEGILPDKIQVILNGIPPIPDIPQGEKEKLRNQLSIKEGQLMVLSVGRLALPKGHAVLLEAIAILPQLQKENLQFFIAGDGSLRKELENQASRLDIQGQVTFLGIRQDVPKLLRAADIFVLPSLWEGLPLVILEAMSAGLPILASDVEGITDAIQDGESGIVIPIKDPGAMKDKLILLANQPELRETLGKNGKINFKDKFDIDTMCHQYEELFQQK